MWMLRRSNTRALITINRTLVTRASRQLLTNGRQRGNLVKFLEQRRQQREHTLNRQMLIKSCRCYLSDWCYFAVRSFKLSFYFDLFCTGENIQTFSTPRFGMRMMVIYLIIRPRLAIHIDRVDFRQRWYSGRALSLPSSKETSTVVVGVNEHRSNTLGANSTNSIAQWFRCCSSTRCMCRRPQRLS